MQYHLAIEKKTKENANNRKDRKKENDVNIYNHKLLSIWIPNKASDNVYPPNTDQRFRCI